MADQNDDRGGPRPSLVNVAHGAPAFAIAPGSLAAAQDLYAGKIDYATFYADEVMPYAIAMLPQQTQALLGAADTK